MEYVLLAIICLVVGMIVGTLFISDTNKKEQHTGTGRVGLLYLPYKVKSIFERKDMTIDVRVWVKELAFLDNDLSRIKAIYASQYFQEIKDFLEPYYETNKIKWYNEKDLPAFHSRERQ